jgi:hypothetical protein
MRMYACKLVLFLALTSPGMLAQNVPNGTGVGSSRVGMPLVVGAPYSADETQVMARVFKDGERATVTGGGKVFRDWNGRTRSERATSAAATPTSSVPSPITIEIKDPIAGLKYVFDSQSKIVHRSKLPPPAGIRSVSPGHPNPGTTTIDLGSKTIEGLRVHGTKTSTLIGKASPTGAYAMTTESWFFPDLMINFVITVSDPNHGDSSTTLSNIQRAAPDPSLFQPPANYTIVDDAGNLARHPKPVE